MAAGDHCELRGCGPEPLSCIFDAFIIRADRFVNRLKGLSQNEAAPNM